MFEISYGLFIFLSFFVFVTLGYIYKDVRRSEREQDFDDYADEALNLNS